MSCTAEDRCYSEAPELWKLLWWEKLPMEAGGRNAGTYCSTVTGVHLCSVTFAREAVRRDCRGLAVAVVDQQFLSVVVHDGPVNARFLLGSRFLVPVGCGE